jgi:hypothetical protein
MESYQQAQRPGGARHAALFLNDLLDLADIFKNFAGLVYNQCTNKCAKPSLIFENMDLSFHFSHVI